MKIKIKINHLVVFLTFFLIWQGSMTGKLFTDNVRQSIMPLLTWIHIPVTVMLILYTYKKKGTTKRIIAKNYISELKILPIAILLTAPIYYAISPIARGFGMPYITRWGSEYLSRICIIIAIYCLFVIAGKEIISIASVTAIALSAILLGYCFVSYGVVPTLKNVFIADTEIQHVMETNDISFTIGIFILYLFFFDKGTKHKKVKLTLSIVFFLMAGKRIAIAGLVVAIVLGIWFKHKALNKRKITIIGFIGVLATLGFLFIIYNNSLLSLLSRFGINPMGRDMVYPYFIRRSSFGPQFLGWGQAAVSKMLENMTFEEVGNMVVLRGLHSDIIKRYLDCGFIGYLFWSSFNLIYLPRKIFTRFGPKAAEVYLMISGYAFITYLTDNTESMYTVQVLVYLVPLIYYTQNIDLDSRLFSNLFHRKKKGILL